MAARRPLRKIALCGLLLANIALPASATQNTALISPTLKLPASPQGERIALTFDACSGKVDMRILDTLIDLNIKSTLFVTARWLKRNPEAIALIKDHPELFEIENHGARHLVAINAPLQVFGVASAGSPPALAAEVENGAAAITAVFGSKPRWFRGATATYTVASEEQITRLGYRIAGFSRLGDGGASYSATRTRQSFEVAVNGEVIIAHINQPTKAAGVGVVEGLHALKNRGVTFVTLDEAFTLPPESLKPDRPMPTSRLM